MNHSDQDQGKLLSLGNTCFGYCQGRVMRSERSSKRSHLGEITAAQTVCAALNDVDLAGPHMWQPLGKLLSPRQAQAGRYHHQQGPMILWSCKR